MPVIEIKFPNGDQFELDQMVIAKLRTSYYARVDGFDDCSQEWEDEFKQSMRPEEISDWLANNTDWSDVKDYAKKIELPKVEPDYDKDWNHIVFQIK